MRKRLTYCIDVLTHWLTSSMSSFQFTLTPTLFSCSPETQSHLDLHLVSTPNLAYARYTLGRQFDIYMIYQEHKKKKCISVGVFYWESVGTISCPAWVYLSSNWLVYVFSSFPSLLWPVKCKILFVNLLGVSRHKPKYSSRELKLDKQTTLLLISLKR